MGRLPGRKSMILMTDDLPIRREERNTEGAESVMLGGDVRNYGGWLQKIAETAIRSSVVIYSVDTQGLQYTGITAADGLRGMGNVPGIAGTNDVPARSAQLGMISARSRTLISRAEGSLQNRTANGRLPGSQF